MLGWTALTWVLIIPAVGCWPAAGVLAYFVAKWWKRHDEAERIERERQGLPPLHHHH